ncbi:helix-turn-helix domain-containing protein [Erythrobacter sp. KY5]|uniref:helix-turn-helix domain-containing protein n=1 Tax=Erythrobacter sp. KY5 TaxID=2011159 RepID=UPI000DBF2D0B|nr:helix-turn-helix domain-containing protein [Erythrobacter sp. KY5]AWW73813.1 helix-turn-helix domain-containing protein [Erythrobacter sp. KY5]
MDSEQDTTFEGDSVAEDTTSDTAGGRLREAREAKRLDLAHVAAETRIPLRHLEAIEEGDYASLPSRTYAIGFARNYARVVALDAEQIVGMVRDELSEGQARQSAMQGGMEPGDPAKLPSSGLAWFGGIAALIFAIGAFAFASTYFGAGADLPSLIAQDDAAAEEGADAGEVAVAANEASSADTSDTVAPPTDGQVVFTATGEGAWVRFYEEGGERLYEGVMEEGDTFEVPLDADDPRLNTGRPNLFQITINGQAVPPLAEEMVPVGDAPVSAAALLARANSPDEPQITNN